MRIGGLPTRSNPLARIGDQGIDGPWHKAKAPTIKEGTAQADLPVEVIE